MKQKFEYNVDNKSFHTRFDFIDYCHNRPNSKELFNSAEFTYRELPEYIDINEKIDPVDATSDWVNGLKQNDKPIALLFGGGLDSIFVLDCMIKSNCPPDYLLIYTSNPFDNYDFFCGVDMEPRYALRYADEIISNNPVLKHTKIWHINLDKKHAEDWFANDDWLRQLSFGHSVESMDAWKFLPKISDIEAEKYTFIKGGNFPKVKMVENKPQFYLVDLQLGSIIDTPVKKTHDFILDNPKMFKYLCCQYYDFIVNNHKNYGKHKSLEKMFECHKDHTDKRYLEDFSKFIPTMPPQLDKRFDSLLPYIKDVKVDESFPYYSYLNRTCLKCWLLYLQAEFIKPNWFENYKKTALRNEQWIKTMNAYPGKITKPSKILDNQ